ncbi:MAG TPA: hypothetical protein VHA77_00380 [Xanthobacteraceae bacterium]|nr:hypothetical protein [Xanthobacteraceae bacterium]
MIGIGGGGASAASAGAWAGACSNFAVAGEGDGAAAGSRVFAPASARDSGTNFDASGSAGRVACGLAFFAAGFRFFGAGGRAAGPRRTWSVLVDVAAERFFPPLRPGRLPFDDFFNCCIGIVPGTRVLALDILAVYAPTTTPIDSAGSARGFFMAMMSNARPSKPARAQVVRRVRLLALVGLGVLLAGCASTIADLPSPVGLPTGTPERSATPAAYPAVHDMPPPRSTTVMSEDEQKKAEDALMAARDRQAKRVRDAAKDQ